LYLDASRGKIRQSFYKFISEMANTSILNLRLCPYIFARALEYWDLYGNYTTENWWHHFYENKTEDLEAPNVIEVNLI
jgi:hypothetical protein